MANAPSAQAVLRGEGLCRQASAIEIIPEWSFAHKDAECNYIRYDMQGELYLASVLDQCRSWGHSFPMRISLKDARKRAKLSQERLGELADSGRSTIVKLEQGVLAMTEAWAKRLAPHLGVKPDELYEGPQIPVIGFVGAGARVYAYDDLLDAGETIDRPPMTTGDLFAVEVKGDSMLPLAEEGWHIVYTAEATVDEHAVLNKVCVVQLEIDDSMLVKRVVRGSKPYHYYLLSTNAAAIEDVQLRWAAVVKAIVPR